MEPIRPPDASSGRRPALALLLDVAFVAGAIGAVFSFTLAHGGEETGGLVAIVYTGIFALVVIPALELFFVTWSGTTPGRALLGFTVRSGRSPAPTAVVIAPIHLRVVARVIDAAMACVLFAGIFIVMAIVVGDISAAWFKTTVLCLLLMPAIEAASVRSFGATPGKRKVGIRVVDAAHPERGVGLFSCFVRAYLVWFLFPLWWVLPIFVWGWAFADPQRRGLHDLVAGTKVTATRTE